MRKLIYAGLVASMAFGPMACKTVVERGAAQYEVDSSRLAQSPPPPAALAPGDATSEVVTSDVSINPEETVGYDILPEELKEIYDGQVKAVSITDVIVQTLTNSRAVKIQDYSYRIAELDIPVSKGIYDLLINASVSHTHTDLPSMTSRQERPNDIDDRERAYDVSLSQLLPTGGTVSLFTNAARNHGDSVGFSSLSTMATTTGNTSYDMSSGVRVSQPLLQGFGPTVTNANIHIAQLGRQSEAADFQNRIEDQLQNALQSYWNLIGAVEEYKVRAINYAAALDLLRINNAKFEQGVVPKTDVLQSEAAAESRRESVIRARQSVRDVEDLLKRQIFLQDAAPAWELQIEPTQNIAWREIAVTLDGTIDVAMANRAELRAAKTALEQNRIREKVAKNNILPQLDLSASVQSNGLSDGYDGSFDRHKGGDFVGYTAQLEFTYPLQNRQARYQYKQSQLRTEQAIESLRDTEDQVTLEVRQAHRDLTVARERIRVTESQVRSEESKMESERKRYEVGISTAFQVLEFQEDLAAAQSSFINAVIDYNNAAIALDRARGTLLETYGVTVDGADLDPDFEPAFFPVGMN